MMQVMHHQGIMRTTVSIPDDLLRAARTVAHDRGTTLSRLVDEALRRELASPEPVEGPPPVPVYDGRGSSAPGVDLTSDRALFESLDEGVPLGLGLVPAPGQQPPGVPPTDGATVVTMDRDFARFPSVPHALLTRT